MKPDKYEINLKEFILPSLETDPFILERFSKVRTLLLKAHGGRYKLRLEGPRYPSPIDATREYRIYAGVRKVGKIEIETDMFTDSKRFRVDTDIDLSFLGEEGHGFAESYLKKIIHETEEK